MTTWANGQLIAYGWILKYTMYAHQAKSKQGISEKSICMWRRIFNNSISDNKGIDGEISSRKGVLT